MSDEVDRSVPGGENVANEAKEANDPTAYITDASLLAVGAAANRDVVSTEEEDSKKRPPISPIVKTAVSISTTSRSRWPKLKFPPPFPDFIYGYHQNDILSGRGATINQHPGNKLFRSMCADRKPEFDTATNGQKRQIALQIVESVLEWNPPGRFIERVNDTNANCSPQEVEQYFYEVDVDTKLVGSSLVYFNNMGYTQKKNKKLMRELGPWRDMGIEKAIQKACGVIRDHKRPDRVALRAMGMLRKKKEYQSYFVSTW